jgi:hypothetical protein
VTMATLFFNNMFGVLDNELARTRPHT